MTAVMRSEMTAVMRSVVSEMTAAMRIKASKMTAAMRKVAGKMTTKAWSSSIGLSPPSAYPRRGPVKLREDGET
uniref:Uncharacterized protein n=1 Tax=Timema tahoe TaxID=61484 RepID=A0A7R9IL38_9NEOP|nr:unnamed protein product [Timema tahoe]